jgi:subtilisin-like proprotein convertase family protein
MRTRLRTAACLVVALLLASCGGGEPTAPLISDTCNSTRLWAQPDKSGRAIPDNNPQGISVRWNNQNCTLKSVTTATLDICLRHTLPSDLSWTIIPPVGNPVPVPVGDSWNSTDISCNNNAGKFQRLNVLAQLGNNTTTQGDWVLQVSDLKAGDTGTFIQWQLILEGLK